MDLSLEIGVIQAWFLKRSDVGGATFKVSFKFFLIFLMIHLRKELRARGKS